MDEGRATQHSLLGYEFADRVCAPLRRAQSVSSRAVDLQGNIPFHSSRWRRPFLAIVGLALFLQRVLAVQMYLTPFPTPTLKPVDVLRRLDEPPQTNHITDSQILVGIEWATAATFRCRMTNELDYQWTNALQEWRWFATWIPRVPPGPTNLVLRSRVFRMREDGMTDAPVEVTPGPSNAPRASPWNPSKVPLPTLSAKEAIARVDAHLRNQTTTQEEILIVAADWTTPERFNHPRIKGGKYAEYFSFKDPTDGGKWVWIVTTVHRFPPVYAWQDPRSKGGKNDGVTLYRVEANGHVDAAFAVGL